MTTLVRSEMIILRVYGTTTHNARKCIDDCYCYSFNNLSNMVSNCCVLMYVIVSLSKVNGKKWLRSRGGALRGGPPTPCEEEEE